MRGENTVDRAVENIVHHYDLSNELFALFLDETMTYSCAVFEPGDTLAQAQERKYARLCAMLDLGGDDHLLEIGTGWGGLAVHAARTTRLPGHQRDGLARASAELAIEPDRGGRSR